VKGPVKDLAASVRQRLLNEARASNRPFQEVLQYFAMERFLYRLSQSSHAKKFILLFCSSPLDRAHHLLSSFGTPWETER